MKKYQNIVCAVDLLEHSGNILKQAVEFKASADAKLILVHFIDPSPVSAYSIGNIDIEDNLAAKAKDKLKDLSSHYDHNVNDIHIIAQHPKHGIDAFARKVSADLIVLGHGTHHFFGNILGSTASAVANHAPCDVFIIKTAH